jgi:hypothetical protein
LRTESAREHAQSFGLRRSALLLVLVPLIRTIGVVLVPLVLVYLLWQRGRQAIMQISLLTAFMALTLGAILAVTVAEPQDAFPFMYVDQASTATPPADTIAPSTSPNSFVRMSMPERFVRTMISYTEHAVRRAIFPPGGGLNGYLYFERLGVPNIRELLCYAIGLILFGGYVRWLTRFGRPTLFALFPLVYLPVLFLWPFPSDRLLYPVLPQLQLSFLLGVGWIGYFIFQRVLAGPFAHQGSLVAQRATLVVVMFLASAEIYTTLRIGASREHAGDLECRTQWLKEHASAAVERLCHTVIWLQGGQMRQTGGASEVLRSYLASEEERASCGRIGPEPTRAADS